MLIPSVAPVRQVPGRNGRASSEDALLADRSASCNTFSRDAIDFRHVRKWTFDLLHVRVRGSLRWKANTRGSSTTSTRVHNVIQRHQSTIWLPKTRACVDMRPFLPDNCRAGAVEGISRRYIVLRCQPLNLRA